MCSWIERLATNESIGPSRPLLDVFHPANSNWSTPGVIPAVIGRRIRSDVLDIDLPEARFDPCRSVLRFPRFEDAVQRFGLETTDERQYFILAEDIDIVSFSYGMTSNRFTSPERYVGSQLHR